MSITTLIPKVISLGKRANQIRASFINISKFIILGGRQQSIKYDATLSDNFHNRR